MPYSDADGNGYVFQTIPDDNPPPAAATPAKQGPATEGTSILWVLRTKCTRRISDVFLACSMGLCKRKHMRTCFVVGMSTCTNPCMAHSIIFSKDSLVDVLFYSDLVSSRFTVSSGTPKEVEATNYSTEEESSDAGTDNSGTKECPKAGRI